MRMTTVLAVLAVIAWASTAMAVPYASGVSESGGTVSFILNEDADSVIVERMGDTPVDLGSLSKGTHSFPLPASAYNIKVSKSAPAGWTQISDDGTPTSFWSPLGISVNRHPWSPNFGRVYVSNASSGTTAFGRSTTSGIYALNADATEVGFYDGGRDWAAAGSSAPFKSTIGPDDHLYVTDFSNDLAFEFSGDMSSVTQLIDGTNKTTGQYFESIHVEGTQAGGDRQIYGVNSHYADARRGLIKYELGGNAAAAANDTGTQYIGPDYFAFYPRDVARDANGNWYMNQYRYDPTEAPAVSKFLDGTPPINTADWETAPTGPGGEVLNGAYGIDVMEELGWVAYGNYYDGWVHIFNMADGSYVGGFDAGSRLREVAFDAAGNVYTVDNTTEWMRIWSPGGNWVAITGSDGTFSLVPEPVSAVLLALGGLLLLRQRR